MSPACDDAIEAAMAESRQALAERVSRYGDDLARALLSCLDHLEALHTAFAGNAVAGARQATCTAAAELAGAGRLITFTARSAEDRALPLHEHAWGATPTRPAGPLLVAARNLLGQPSNPTQTQGQALLDQLEELLREVIFSADMQAYFDARANAVTYLRAATRIRRAASVVAEACRLG